MRLAKTAETALTVSRNAFLGGNLASLALVARPREFVRYIGESLLLYRSLASRTGIPQKNVHEVLKPQGSVEEIVLGNLDGNATWLSAAPSYAVDIVNLCLMCRLLNPSVVFEIGTLTGYTSLHFALNTRKGAVIHTLDLPTNVSRQPSLRTDMADDIGIQRHARAEKYCFNGMPEASKIRTHFGDSAQFDFTPFAGMVDLFFIDGAHSYEYVRSDTLNALKCCHPGSVIAWHDFGRVVVGGVAKWVCEFARDHAVYAVPGGSLAFTVVA